MAGEDRIINDRVDMGAYEWNTFVDIENLIIQTSSLKVRTYPNPFSTSTTITYKLQQSTTIQITIFTHLGKQVDFIQQNQSQGKQQITWDATGLQSGVYYFRLKAGEQMATGKLVLVR